ncbi:MAG TPA: DNA polymerase III subunit alpha [Trueperaceae bacterium]
MSGQVTRFAHLHQHTAYSLLDGAARISELVKWVKEVSPNDPAVAMTDHGNMHGAVEFYKTCVKEGVRPIIGFEAYVAPGSRFEKRRGSAKLDGGYYHLTLLAKDFKGYQSLCRLSSRAYLEGFYMKPRIDMELLREHSEGVIALSGCLGAQIPRAILDLGPDEGERLFKEHLDIFGANFFVEIQDHGLEEQRRLNPVLKELATRYGVGLVATNDGHYVKREDAHAHDVLLAIQTKEMVSNEDRMRFPCDEFYVKTPQEMAAAIPESEYPGAIDNTNAIADMVTLELPIGAKRVYQMPELKLPEGVTLADQLRVDTYRGLMRRYPSLTEAVLREYLAAAAANERTAPALGVLPRGTSPSSAELDDVLLALAKAGEASRLTPEELEGDDEAGVRLRGGYSYPHVAALKHRLSDAGQRQAEDADAWTVLQRCEYELAVVISMGFADYYLIVADFINWAKSQGISVGPGRGSGAGSIVAYAIGITNIDPLRFGLLFERFLNPERISMPDFDIDFSDVRRGEVIDYVREKYGDERVAHIATFGTMASRAAIKDAARVLDVPYAESDRVSKLVPVVMGRSVKIEDALRDVPELRELYEQGAKSYIDVARTLEGLTRHASVHAAGVVIARDPVTDLAPVFRSGDGPVVVQYDMSSVEELGYIKMDFLGLRTLSFIEAARRIVKDSRGVDLDPDAFPQDDPAVFELLSRGDAAGIFQFESPGMVDTLRKLKPKRIQDLIAVNSLYRPGPMENIPAYIRRHHGQEDVDYSDFPNSAHLLTPILEETYGIPVYQEQVMQIVQAVAGYSLGQADIMRRAMGKKKADEMERQRAVFREGAGKKGIDAREADRIFDLLERFASYGFNKSHAAAYVLLSYQTAYLKAHYPVEFAAALLTVERGDSDKVAQYVADARHMGVEVLPPDINLSRADFTPDGEVVRFGLYGIKNVGEAAVDHVIAERVRAGHFKDLYDFCARVDTTLVNKRAVEYLVKAGAFDRLAAGNAPAAPERGAALAARAALLANLDLAVRWGAARREQHESGQLGLFGDTEVAPPSPVEAGEVEELEMLRYEKEALGIYLSAHPMASYPGLVEAATCHVAQVDAYFKDCLDNGHQGRVRLALAGLVQNVVKRPTRKGLMMARFELADETASREVVAFGRTYDDVAPLLEEDVPVVLVADVSEDGDATRLVADRLIRWDKRGEAESQVPEVAVVSFRLDRVAEHQLLEFRSLLDEFAGRTPVRLAVSTDDGRYLYDVEGAAVDAGRLEELRATCPWLKASLTVDKRALVASRAGRNGFDRRPREAPVEVPF